MWLITIIYGDVLILLGVAGWFMIHGLSWKAWIPAVFGILLSVLGALARVDKFRKHAMHTAVLVSLASLIAALPGVLDLNRFMAGDPTVHRNAVIIKVVMVVVAVIYIALCVKSFVDARRKK